MPRRNKNAGKVYPVSYKQYARLLGLTPMQRVKIYKFIMKGGVTK